MCNGAHGDHLYATTAPERTLNPELRTQETMYFSTMCILENHESWHLIRTPTTGEHHEEKPESSGDGCRFGSCRCRFGHNVCASQRTSRCGALPLSQYVSSTSTTVCNANPVITTYHGTVVLDIPITALLAGHEAEIRAAAAQGLSPHDSGSDYNSDIALTVSVPDGVMLGTGRATSTSSMLTNTWFSPTLTTHRSLRTSNSRICPGSSCSISSMQRKPTPVSIRSRSRSPMPLAQLTPRKRLNWPANR